MDNALFNTKDIFDFLLDKDFPLFASSWLSQKGIDGTITHLDVSNWFLTYFPSHNAFKLFRQLECEKNQMILNF